MVLINSRSQKIPNNKYICDIFLEYSIYMYPIYVLKLNTFEQYRLINYSV